MNNILTIIISVLLLNTIQNVSDVRYSIEIPNYPVVEQKIGAVIQAEAHPEGHPAIISWKVLRPGYDIFSDGFESGNVNKWQRYNTRVINLSLDAEGYWVVICRTSYDHESGPGVKYYVEDSIVVKVVP